MLYKSKKIIQILITLALLQSILLAEQKEKKNILLIHSYHAGMTWIDNINKAVDNILKPELNNYIIYKEYMDTKRHNSKEYYESLKEIYLKKYQNIKFDIILSSDNNAFDFLVKNKNELFGNSPVSFCGVNGFEKSMLKGKKDFTGVAEQFSDKETVDTILKLHPKVKNIYIINDYLPTGKAWSKDMKKSLKIYDSKVNITYADNLTLEQLKSKVNSFTDETVVLLGVYFADKNKNYITYEKIGSYLLEQSAAPVYCLLNFNILNNVIGGKVIGGYSQGEAMSKIALRILNGEKPNDIKIKFAEANEYIFNHNGITKYNLDQSLLPKNSKIINKPFSLYEEYKYILFNLMYMFISVILLFFIILFYIRYKNRSKGGIRDELIISIIRFAPVVIIPIMTGFIVWLFLYSTNTKHQELKKVEKINYIENMKQISKNEVDRYVQVTKSILSSTDKKDIKKIKNLLLDIAKETKYGKSGYIIVGTLDGYMLSHPNKNLVGSNFFDGKHEKAKEVFLKFKKRIDKDSKGFVEYEWNNPSSKSLETKITYVNIIPQLKWYVASGVYLDEIDRTIEDKIKKDAIYDDKNINIILLTSIVLLGFSLIISIVLSVIIKNVFKNYRKNILDEVKKSKIIQKAKEEFETIFKYAQDGIAITNLDGDFIKFNDAFKKMTGYNQDQLIKKNCQDLTLEEDRVKNQEAIKKAIKIGHVENFEKKCIMANNQVITVHISISILPDKQSLLMIIKDASSIKLLEEQSKNAAMGEMIGNIAHQWRQPLSVISTGATGLMVGKEYNTLNDQFFKETCEAINNNAQYLSKTIDDFKDFIKGERKLVNFNLSKNINSFLHLVEGAIKGNNIQLILDLDDSIIINGYPNELIQCFINIFNNAKDALKNIENSDRVIFISTKQIENGVTITFKDNAGGIPQDVLPHIFEPYFTTKHQSKGTGLGLSMTYNLIVKGMDGSIEAHNTRYIYNSKEYSGAIFNINL